MRTVMEWIVVLGLICLIPKISIAENIVSDFHGFISEDASPNTPVRIIEGNRFIKNINDLEGSRVCGYTLYKSEAEMPFKVVDLIEETGEATLALNNGYSLDYNRNHAYSFEISAHDCKGGTHADRYTVHIEVEKNNKKEDSSEEVDNSKSKSKEDTSKSSNEDPSWTQDSYTIEVEEKKLYDDILQLEVEGLNEAYEGSCKFDIISADVPFIIDNKDKLGILRNTEKLDYQRQHNYILQVKAEGCGEEEGKANKPLIINIQVKESLKVEETVTCRQGWEGINSVIDYEPGSGIKVVAKDAHLKLCDKKCDAKEITIKVKLTTDHIGKGCDRDTYSIQSQRKLCGASDGVIDLLPSPSEGKWTEGLSKDDGSEGDQMFYFDGEKDAIEVPKETFEHDLKQHFTIMTWMKHEKPTEDIDVKEHIMCNADGDGKNRHHYSLFVHHCKLVLLVRREYQTGMDLNEFKPAEWRWLSSEMCDGQWHHYSASLDYPDVRLYIDGKRFVESGNNPEIIDDWALHPATKVHFTKLMIGACWMGFPNEKKDEEQAEATGHSTQFFAGYLAGLSILNGKSENERVLKCITVCQEKLDFHAMQDMESGMSVAFNSEMSEITIQGGTVDSVEKLFHKVGYINSRLFPTQGHRKIHVITEVTCADDHKENISETETSIFVLPAAHPIITITGTQVLSKTEGEFSHGVPLFTDLNIMSKTQAEREELEFEQNNKAEDVANEIFSDKSKESSEEEQNNSIVKDIEYDDAPYKLDSCMLHVEPPMDFKNFEKGRPEYLKYPANLVDQLMLEAYQNEDGLIISGAEKVSNYVKVMRQVKYFHARPEEINTRTFVLTCSELNGRFVSNEFKVVLEVMHVIHNANEAKVPSDHIQDHKMMHPVESYHPGANQQIEKSAFIGSIGQGVAAGAGNAAGAGLGMIIIIVVCVGFLMFMIVLGVMRIRSAQHRTNEVQMEEKAEMEWDDSALTITVNPMDQDTAFEENEMAGVHGEDTDSDDDSDYHEDHEDVDSSEEEPDLREFKGRSLEWDESDLSKYQCKV